VVALTFDDGPSPEGTPPILDVLSRRRVKATFFVVGRKAAEHADVLRAIVRGGHAVGNHSFTHALFPRLPAREVAREILRCRGIVRHVAGVTTTLVRPPHGAMTAVNHLVARATGHAVVHWSASGEDWLGQPGPWVAERVLREVRPGGIAALHDGWEPEVNADELASPVLADRRPTIEAVEILIERLGRSGYRFVTVPEMLRLGPAARMSWLW
jgi:peptidoglycan/xylan/chitin deacetylase (PgdA/CDA1 family)